MKIFVLLGSPGSGKGTISWYLSERHNLFHLSTGTILRNLVSSTANSGELVSDDITNKLIKKHIDEIVYKDEYSGIILDGFPRTIDQAEFLKKHFDVDKVIYLENVPEEVIISRLSSRVLCREKGHVFNINQLSDKDFCIHDGSELYRRPDDSRDVIKKRLEVYQTATMPIIKWYEQQKQLFRVNANADIDVWYPSIIELLF